MGGLGQARWNAVGTTRAGSTARRSGAGATIGHTTWGRARGHRNVRADHSASRAVPGSYSHLAAGYYHVCGVDSTTYELKCWGWNPEGQAAVGFVQEFITSVTST